MHIQADRALIPAHTPSVRHLTVTITAPGRPRRDAQRHAANVALVLDRSGSMDGQKIAMAREAVAHAIRLLDARDRLTVVAYDDHVDTILPMSHATKETRALALRQLARVDARGATDLAAGWSAGVDGVLLGLGAAGAPAAGAGAAPPMGRVEGSGAGAQTVSRVLLLTDGLANRGVVDHEELVRAAMRFRTRGVATSTFGLGADFDEELLSRLATEGGGHFYFIERATQIPDFLASELGDTLEVVARDVVLDLTCSNGLDVMVLNGYPMEASPGRVRVLLGDLIADQEIALALAVSCRGQWLESTSFVNCRVTDRDGVMFPTPLRMEWRAVAADENDRQPVNYAVLVAAAEVLAERARVTALNANRRGDYAEAQRVLRDMIEHVQGLAPGRAEIAAIVDRLKQDEATMGHGMASLSRKRRYFGSHAASFSRDLGGRAKKGREGPDPSRS